MARGCGELHSPALAALVLAAAALCLPLSAARAHAPAVGLYFDADCTNCSASVQLGVPFDLYVAARLGGALAAGLQGAEFRVTGLPPEYWILERVPNTAASVVVGDPAGAGCHMSFDTCIGDPGGCVVLFVLRILPTAVLSDVRLRVLRPSSPCDTCYIVCGWRPVLAGCDAPLFTKYCDAPGGEASINGAACTVGAATATWSSVKSLFE